MKITVLGGAGSMGSRATRDIAEQNDVTNLVIADINLAAASQLANELNTHTSTKKITAVHVDANIPSTVISAIANSDIVLSAVGPYFKFGRMVIESAITAGTDIVDICDDYDAVQEILSLHDKATAKGVTVLTGMGWTPGLSNLLALKAINTLDSANEVYVYWAGSPLGDSGLAVILHTLHIFTGKIPTFDAGKLVNIPAGSGREVVEFKDLGSCTMFHVGHPEPITLPRFLPTLSRVVLKGGLTDNFFNEAMLLIGNMGIADAQESKELIASLLKSITPFAPFFLISQETRSAIKVVVKGLKQGKNTQITYEANADMADLTGLPLSIGGLMLGRNKINKQVGIYAPEAIINCNEFISEMQTRGINVTKTEELNE